VLNKYSRQTIHSVLRVSVRFIFKKHFLNSWLRTFVGDTRLKKGRTELDGVEIKEKVAGEDNRERGSGHGGEGGLGGGKLLWRGKRLQGGGVAL